MRKTIISGMFAAIMFVCLFPLPGRSEDRDRTRQDMRQRRMDNLQQNLGIAAPQPLGPWMGAGLKDAPREWGAAGALVSEVAAGSPAGDAGIMPGDIITKINGKAVNSESELRTAAANLAEGRLYGVAVNRGGRAFNLEIAVSSQTAASAKYHASDINVLKYAVIDPRSRSIILLGRYDAAYKTGPIPYYEILNDALQSPYPWFSLEPTEETKNAVMTIHSAIESDVQRMSASEEFMMQWTARLMNLLLNDPAMSQDRTHFVTRGAEAFGISEDEMLTVLRKSANDPGVSTDSIMPILGKILLKLGYDTLGEALIRQDEGSEATFMRLGISEQASPIISQYHSGQITEEKATLQLSVLMVSAILRGLRVPEAEINSRAQNVLNGRMSMDSFTKFMEDTLMAIITDQVGLKMFNGLTLSHEILGRLYNVPVPRMNLVFKDVSSTSLLGDAMFRADVALKSICTNSDIKSTIPGFLTEMDYLYKTSITMGTRIPGDAGAEVGHRLVPGVVRMSFSPDGNLVSFDDAEIKIIGWVMDTAGKNSTPEVARVIKSSTEGYADYLTQHFDEIARIYPELHRIREVEKLIALARWAQANNYKIVVDRAFGVKLAQAPTAPGFWQGVFTADAQEFSLTVIALGGVSFDREEGDDWVVPAPESRITDNVLEQLAASASFARQAAVAAVAGDLDEARDLAEKSARAMTGEIDLRQFPALDVPIPGDPAPAAALSEEALAVVDQNLRALDNAEITMEKAADLEAASPADAQQLYDMAKRQKEQAEQHLRDLNDALETVRKDPVRVSEAAVVIRNINTMPTTGVIPVSDAPAVAGAASTTTVKPPAAAAKPGTSKTKEELLAEMESLQKELDAVKTQLARLNQNIMSSQQQFSEWQEVSESGMEKCKDILFGLFMDASAGKLADRYETMYDLAKKLPDQPQPLIKRLGRTNELFTGLKDVKSFKDVLDWAYANGDTLPEAIDKIRDGVGLITSLKGWDKTLVGAAWIYGSNIVDLTYSYMQYSTSYDALMQQTQNVDEFNRALASLKGRMDTLFGRVKDVKQQLADIDENEEF